MVARLCVSDNAGVTFRLRQSECCPSQESALRSGEALRTTFDRLEGVAMGQQPARRLAWEPPFIIGVSALLWLMIAEAASRLVPLFY